ncbi:MAG TPA: redox-regulated ATPase YchF [Chloroflexi bacterium]|nr:redox-regulated ATPase YchF [Chloroflexota bacterium]
MSLQIGIVGLPNVGKSTLFNALTRAGAAVAAYPFTTIEPNRGVVAVPDRRLAALAELVGPELITPAMIEFVDIAGLVRGAHQGEGLGNQFLGHIRDVDAIALVCRCFASGDVAHVEGTVNPVRDVEVLDLELILADLQVLERRIEKVQSAAKARPREYVVELEGLQSLREHLQAGERAATWAERGATEAALAQEINLLTAKERIYVANVGEEDLPDGGPLAERIDQVARDEGTLSVALCAQLEADLSEWPPDEAAVYRADVGLERSGLEALAWAGYAVLDLITFFTITGGRETRAWALQRGAKAPQAAGKVHSQMEQGFIRVEVVSFEQLVEVASWAAARERGILRIEGRDYQVQDGDVCLFRFSP